jgi:response regulator RpfG family c-di-GMP phosphodiesterase
MIDAERNRHFDPQVVDAFMAVVSVDIESETSL